MDTGNNNRQKYMEQGDGGLGLGAGANEGGKREARLVAVVMLVEDLLAQRQLVQTNI
jgi:hypothetical protein